MSKENQNEDVQNQPLQNETVSIFSKEILRDVLLPDLLGKEHTQVLYWAGKQLARKFPLTDLNEVIDFFENAGWGILQEEKHTKNEAEFTLFGPIVTRRFDLNEDSEFQLEAGFLAQQIELQKKRITEAAPEAKRKAEKAKFIVRWDTKDIVDDSQE
ncbi:MULTISPECIES: YslB family protein [Bacillus]|uniref:YslB family protein n=1 Tax=Bacillus TaxID=1386 RepID=UPI0002FEEBAD|nr:MULTISPECIES: YslB family protein [Bacillus]